MKKLKVTATFTWYITTTEKDIQSAMELNNWTREEVLQSIERYENEETIGRLEGRLDNQCVEDWSDEIKMEWIE